MRTIRYWTSHPERSPQYWREWFCLPQDIEFVFDQINPDYLIVSEHIYSDPCQCRTFLRLDSTRRISIFASGEAVSPDMNLFDYAISFDKDFQLGDRIARKPPALFFQNHIFSPLTEGCADPRAALSAKSRFCNFIYSNPKAHPRRDQLFYALNGYRGVDSLGSHLNNCGNATSRSHADWRRILVDMKRPYKFSIAAENAVFAGYTTEKLISSFLANTVPIYWGNPSVADEFNPKAFINANGLSDKELIEAVRRVDENDDLWCKMVSEPLITIQQKTQIDSGISLYRAFTARIFDDRAVDDKKRAPSGSWNDIYRLATSKSARSGVLQWLLG